MATQGAHGITWTQQTWNPIRGCSKVNTDCRNCYAERVAVRFSGPSQPYGGLLTGGRWNGTVRMIEDHLRDPLKWQRPRLVFVNSMSDLFHESLTDDQIGRIVDVMAQASRHTFQVLTKRPERMARYLPTAAARHTAPDGSGWPLPNVWWGASMGHQKAVDELLPALMRCRKHAAVLWVSAEPLIERITLDVVRTQADAIEQSNVRGLDWVVGGGESQTGARPCPLVAARNLRNQCLAADVPFHWKQWGEWGPVTYYEIPDKYEADNGLIYTLSEKELTRDTGGKVLGLVGKRAAGRRLDGRTWDEWPRGFTPQQTGA